MSTETDPRASLGERFEIGEEIARGRLSTVVRATRRDNGRIVALKILHDHFRDNQAVLQRLRRELAVTRRLEHPAILRIDDLIETEEVVALVMEFIDGRSVRELVQQEGAQSWERTRLIIETAAEALEDAHDKGIWHRDLSAHHIMVDEDGGVKVVGFGFARVDELVGLTMHTRVLGALEAMAPERILGMSYDGRADIYSLGAVMRELITGHPPIDGGMSEAFARATGAVDEGEKDALPEDLPAAARYALERALARDPGVRFATASQMGRALRGDFDVARWNAWVAREARYCPDCETPIIDGLFDCLECGYEFKRLVQNPGGGEHMIRVVSNFDRNIFPSAGEVYQVHHDPKMLTERQFQSLMDFLGDHEDTASFADGRWEYQWPPYILLSELELVEAHRISEKLEEAGIHNDVRQSPGRPPLGGTTKTDVYHLFTLAVAAFLGSSYWAWSNGVNPAWIAVGAVLFVGTGLLLHRSLHRLAARSIEGRETESISGVPLMIPPVSMSGAGPSVDQKVVPEETGQALKKLSQSELAQEIYELVVLAVATVREEAGSTVKQARSIIEEVLRIGGELDSVVQELEELSSAELVSRIESVDARLATEEFEEATALIEEKAELFDQMAHRDELEYRQVSLRMLLLKARGTLLELRAQDSTTPLEDADTADLDELRILLEAHQEVEEAVTVGAI